MHAVSYVFPKHKKSTHACFIISYVFSINGFIAIAKDLKGALAIMLNSESVKK